MRAYTVATVAVTLGVSPKWLDNALSHNRVDGVIQARQGVSRKLSPHAVVTLYVALRLIEDLETPLRRALKLATELARSSGSHTLSEGLSISLDIDRSIHDVTARLARAVEITPLPQRGRPAIK